MKREDFYALSALRARQEGTVIALEGGQECQARLVSMGVHVGCDLKVLHSSEGQDSPTLIAIGDTRLAIGREMLDSILVAVEP
jgi:Fe2+ transport system protein FeoA